MKRRPAPEILDTLPPGDPDAVHSRRDLLKINRFMGNGAWFEQILPGLVRPGEAALELGSGNGELGLRLQARGIAVDGLDLGPRPAAWPPRRAWHTSDLRSFGAYQAYPVVLGNLILHHLPDEDLRGLGSAIGRTARVILASEPSRTARALAGFAILAPLIGANAVTRHDGRVSIRAGFTADDLPLALGLDPTAWSWTCTTSLRGAYRMVALRRDFPTPSHVPPSPRHRRT